MGLRYLDMEALRAAPRASEPFEYLVVPGFVRADACARINADYPKISQRGSFPISQLAFGPAFQEFLDELESDEFRTAFEEKFAINLTGRPTTITVRGQCSHKDGQIHTDSLSKIITVLIYMNPGWEESGGRLRLHRRDGEERGPPEHGPPRDWSVQPESLSVAHGRPTLVRFFQSRMGSFFRVTGLLNDPTRGRAADSWQD